MKKIDEILSESVNLSEDARTQIQTLWESRIAEARTEIATELRGEFASKYELDKKRIVESMDRFLTDKVRAELEEFAEDKKQLVSERVAYRTNMRTHAEMVNNFIAESLSKEVKELRSDRVEMREGFVKLENFILNQMAGEISELHEDRKALIDQKVKMVAEGKRVIEESKNKFIKRFAAIAESTIDSALKKEITQLREDIRASRENNFGRKMFEAFVSEYMVSHLNEGTEIRKMQSILESREAELGKLKAQVAESNRIFESMNQKVKTSQDQLERQKVLSELVQPLSKEKRTVMTDLLESVQTKNLQSAFNKYLPSVLNESSQPRQSRRLSESVIVDKTGDKSNTATNVDSGADIDKLMILAGLK